MAERIPHRAPSVSPVRSKQQGESSVKEGDVVIVKDEKRPRNTWKLGRVKELVKGRDGKTRGAVVETVVYNQNRLIEISRAVQPLVPVEFKKQSTCQESQQSAEDKLQL